MSNLVPEVRVNKNGVPVVKHVRGNAGSARSKNPLPSPSVAPSYTPKESRLMDRRSEIAHELRLEMGKKKYRIGPKVRAKMFETLHEDTLDVLESICSQSEASQRSINVLMSRCCLNRNFADLNNVMTVADLIHEGGESHYRSLDALVGGLQMTRPEDSLLLDWSHGDKSEWVQPQALYKAATSLDFRLYVRHFSDEGGMTKFLKSPNLAQFVLDHPKDVDRIISILNERNLSAHTDSELRDLKGLLDQQVESAIAEGIL